MSEDPIAGLPRGRDLLNDPMINKGTAFSRTEREALGLEGLLPHRIETLPEQCARIREKYDRLHDDLERHIFLRALQDTNDVLFYGFVERYLTEMLPILYTPTVGKACQEFSQIYRRPHGLFISYPDRDRMTQQFAAIDREIDVVVVTDGERILGLGDQGLGGMGIPIGKLSLYTAAGGLDPDRALPIVLDVGTNNPDLLADPLYLGWRHERIDEADYDGFVDQFVTTLADRFPNALLQWEDFASHHATELLDRYRSRIVSFNDDIQGTAAVALAAIDAATSVAAGELADQRFCIVGAGSAGTGIADMLVQALTRDRVDDPASLLFMVDAQGLLHDGRADLDPFQVPFAQRWDRVSTWAEGDGATSLETIVANCQPTVLIGVSGQPGLFTESVIRTMHAGAVRPIVMPLSNPTSRAEATPADLLEWTNGAALIATGSPFGDVSHAGVTHRISQANNVYVFPGLGLGTLVAEAGSVTDDMLLAAARSVAETSPCLAGDATAGILPPLEEIHGISRRIAHAVATTSSASAGEPLDDDEIHRRISDRWWSPVYQPLIGDEN